MSAEDRIERARLLYERAVFDGDADALAISDRELDGVEADLALARGRVMHTRFLGIAEHRAGRLGGARERLEESARLRREIGLLPGVAANLVGLAYIAAADGRHDDVPALLAEAATIAQATGAHRIMRQVDEARGHL